MELWERFTPRARRAVLSAHSEATRSHAGLIGTGHLLVGLLRLREGGAHSVLQRLNADLERLRTGLSPLVDASSGGDLNDDITFTREVQTVISLACSAQAEMGDDHLGTEHILLGMTRLGEDPTSILLSDCGVTQDRVRDAMADLPVRDNADTGTQADSQG